jgi:hypothetical protein
MHINSKKLPQSFYDVPSDRYLGEYGMQSPKMFKSLSVFFISCKLMFYDGEVEFSILSTKTKLIF